LSYASATTTISHLSLHDALPIYERLQLAVEGSGFQRGQWLVQHVVALLGQELPEAVGDPRAHPHVHALPAQLPDRGQPASTADRSEEHTSELQSRENLVCRLLLE